MRAGRGHIAASLTADREGGGAPLMSSAYAYDVAILADLRTREGVSVAIAHEIRAQYAAGYRTVLVPLPGQQGSFDRAILACVQGGMAALAPPGAVLRVRAAVVRLPDVAAAAESAAGVAADVTVLVVDRSAQARRRPARRPRDEVAAAGRLARETFGPVVVAPTAPDVRESLADVALLAEDWGEVIDVADWETDREGYVADRPVIGVAGLPGEPEWPASEVRAYPPNGGARSSRVRRFLEGIDVLVDLRPDGEVSSPRPVVEALAAGVPAVVPPELEPVFRAAALYATPDTAQAQVAALYADPDRFAAQREAGSAFAAQRFGLDVHAGRLAALIGPPPAPSTPPSRRSAERTVLFVSANGEGMGHLTRLLSIVRRAPGDIKPVFATMSPAFRGVREAGFACEYIPRHPSWSGDVWNPFLMRRLGELISRYHARALVFDGTWPFMGLLDAAELAGCPLVWIRRALWKAGVGAANLERSDPFSLIIEPGELAGEYDRGLTVARRHEALRVAPILQLDPSELLDRDAARSALGLDPDRRAVLIQLGSDDKHGLAFAARTAAERCIAEGLEVVFADWLVSRERVELPAGVKRISVYPLSRYFRAFDFAIARPGYNSFHELIAFGVPSVFLPIETKTDDQYARARWARDAGVGLELSEFDARGFERCLRELLDDEKRSGIAARAAALAVANGAQQATDAIAELVGVPRVGMPA